MLGDMKMQGEGQTSLQSALRKTIDNRGYSFHENVLNYISPDFFATQLKFIFFHLVFIAFLHSNVYFKHFKWRTQYILNFFGYAPDIIIAHSILKVQAQVHIGWACTFRKMHGNPAPTKHVNDLSLTSLEEA